MQGAGLQPSLKLRLAEQDAGCQLSLELRLAKQGGGCRRQIDSKALSDKPAIIYLYVMLFKIPGKKKNQKSEKDLLEEFTLTGDLEVLGELYSGFMHLVYGVCLKYLKDRDESMDAVMQIFEKLITEIPRQRIENFRSWLHVVTRNYCLMQLRSQKSQKEKLNEWMNDSLIFMENSSGLHPIDEDGPHMEKALAKCIERLKDEQKECIRQFYYENKCYNEISLNLGLNEKKVKSHLQNAKRNLKLCLEEKHDGQE